MENQNIKDMKKTSLILIALVVLYACSNNDDNGSVTLSLSASNQNLKSGNNSQAATVVITDFQLSIRDVEFKKDESELNSTEYEFRGPYTVDLHSETDALTQTIGTADVPDGTYKVLRFKLHKDRDRQPTHPLYDRSMYMEGTIDGTPFVFWHDTSENFDYEHADGIVVAGGNVNISVHFIVDQFLNALHTIDLSEAMDDDQDGIIEINPDDDDGNGTIADQLKANIKEAADLIKP